MSTEYAMSPSTQDRYEARIRALNTKITDDKVMIFRRKNDGTVESRTIPGKDVRQSDLEPGWMDSAGKCESDEIYRLACEYPERRAGELRLMLLERDQRLKEETAELARKHREAELAAHMPKEEPASVPEIRTEEPEPVPEPVEEEAEPEAVEEETDDDPRELLILQGEELGLKLDRRMRADTMREKIAEAGAEPVV